MTNIELDPKKITLVISIAGALVFGSGFVAKATRVEAQVERNTDKIQNQSEKLDKLLEFEQENRERTIRMEEQINSIKQDLE